MKRKYRLARPTDFERVRRLGKSYAHPFVVLITLPNELGKIRIGVAAGKSVGGAVKRNRAKRMLRVAVSSLLSSITPGNDIILIARKPITTANSTQVHATMRTLLNKAELINNDEA